MEKNNYQIYKKQISNQQENKSTAHKNKKIYVENLFILKGKTIYLLQTNCRVTVCSSNPQELGYKSNEPNTINL